MKPIAGGNFTLLTPHEGSEFSGLMDQVVPSVRGDLRTEQSAQWWKFLSGWHNSKAYQRYVLPKVGTSFEVEVGVYWNENDTVLKMEIPTLLEKGQYQGQVMFGHDTLRRMERKWLHRNGMH